MQMSQVYRLDRVFFHKLHHPPCCIGNITDYGRQFHEGDRGTRSQSQYKEGLSFAPSRDFCKIQTQPSSLKHQRRSDKMVSFRDYEIYLLFLLLVKFHGSGKCEIYSPVQRILQCFLSCASLSLETVNADPLFLNVTFVKTISVLQSSFQQFFLFQI